MLATYYPEIRLLHVAAVTCSGGLFCLRGFLVNVLGSRWAMAAPVRYLSYLVDTVLLAAAITLTTIIHQYPGVDAWLTVKVALLLVYIVLGSFALKRGRSRPVRIACWLAALLVFGFIVTVAYTHDPLGALSGRL